MEPLDLLKNAFQVGKWIYDQLNTMEENKTKAQELAGRILRLTGVVDFLKTKVKPVKKKSGGSSCQLSPEVLNCLARVEECFAELEGMLLAHKCAASSGGFFGKFKAKAKDFFFAGNLTDQLTAANKAVTDVLGDLETAIAAQGLAITIETNAVLQGLESKVQKQHSDVLKKLDALLSQQLAQGATVLPRATVPPPTKKLQHCWFFANGSCM